MRSVSEGAKKDENCGNEVALYAFFCLMTQANDCSFLFLIDVMHLLVVCTTIFLMFRNACRLRVNQVPIDDGS